MILNVCIFGAVALGPLVGGIQAQANGWRPLFWIVAGIATGRKRSDTEVRKIIDDGPYLAEAAKAAGLVDELGYEDQVNGNPPLKGTRRIEGDAYDRAAQSTTFGAERIALLYGVGTIASGKSAFDTPSGLVLGSDTFVSWVRKVRVDPSIRAVVVRIDSPGGSAIASDVIWREVYLTKKEKPVVASMSDVAASGGYYIAMQGIQHEHNPLGPAELKLIYVSHWSNAKAAEQFFDVYTHSILQRYSGAKLESDAGASAEEHSSQWQTSEGPVLIQRVGDAIVVCESFPLETATRIREAAFASLKGSLATAGR